MKRRKTRKVRRVRRKRGLRRNAPRLNMYTPGEKYIGTLEIAKPDGDYDVWEVVRRGRVFVIGTATNSGLLTDYYFKMEQGESEQKALEEINADLEVLATDGPSYMSRVTKIPKRTMEASRQRADKRRNLRGNPGHSRPAYWKANDIITKDHEYYDDVHYIWRPVPSFWIGDFVGSHSHKIGLFTKSKDSALRKNSTHERGMVNPDLSTRERDQDFSPLKKLVMDLASDFAPVVKDIESTRYSTTQNNYGRYMSLISSMSKGDKKRAEIIAMALITAGANRSGVKSALRVMFGE